MMMVMTHAPHQSLAFQSLDPEEARLKASQFNQLMKRRRSVRDFADTPVDRQIIADCIATAGTAPSGANQQPWHFCAISAPKIKKRIREAAEAEERAFYAGRAGDEWLDALAPLGTDAQKPFLEIAPWLIVIFAKRYGVDADGERYKHYYVNESVGIATGLLITALHNAGLATLTHTPSPMGFLREICGRPDNEKPVILLVVGHPANGAKVPAITRKPLADITDWIE